MRYLLSTALLCAALSAMPAHAAENSCGKLPSYTQLKAALKDARAQDNGGLNNDMWGAVVDRSGTICAVAFTGSDFGAQWPGSRSIAMEKANTANAFSTASFALSTANLYAGTQPGGFLYGLGNSNPLDVKAAYLGPATKFGTAADPAVGKVVGGVIVFGGGFALYDQKGELLGGLGVSGDTSCADNNIGWRTRHTLKLDFVPGGPSSDKTDAIIYDISGGKSASGFGQPTCGNKEDDIAKQLPPVATKG